MSNFSEETKGSRLKRPDRQLYIPRAKRSNAKNENTESPSKCISKENPSKETLKNSKLDGDKEDIVKRDSETMAASKVPLPINENIVLDNLTNSDNTSKFSKVSTKSLTVMTNAIDSPTKELEANSSLHISSNNVKICENHLTNQVRSDVMSENVSVTHKNNTIDSLIESINQTDEDDFHYSNWEKLFDESGESLESQVINELTLAVGEVEIQKPKFDYLDFRPHEPDLSGIDYSHVVELYDFPVEYKTPDLMVLLSPFKDRGFDLKWVDDTHALAIFSTTLVANEAVKMKHPFLKIRPLSEAIPESKWKAKRSTESLQPFKPRPQTSASLARRLVSGALGLKVNVTKEQREKERQKIIEAKESRKKVLKQKRDVWDGAA